MEECTIRRLNGEILHIINSNESDGLYTNGKFESDAEVADFIKENLEIAIMCSIIKSNHNEYILNIFPIDGYGAMPTEGEIQLTRHQTEIYLPIIKYFLQFGFKSVYSEKECIF